MNAPQATRLQSPDASQKMAFKFSPTQPTSECCRGSCWVAITYLPGVNVLSQALRLVAGLSAAHLSTGSVQQPPWECKLLVSPSQCHSPGFSAAGCALTLLFQRLCSEPPIPWRLPWLRSLPDEELREWAQSSGKADIKQSEYTPENCWLKWCQAKSKACVFSWKGI